MDTEKNIYGLSEGVFKACQFLGLKFPPKVPKKLSDSQEHMPSDYFGDDFELDADIKKKLCSEREWTNNNLAKEYSAFTEKYFSQKCFSKHTKTDLNIYFVDYTLFAEKQQGTSAIDYFDFEFYQKSFERRNEFMTQRYRWHIQRICNEYNALILVRDKAKTNKIFNDFLRRDWLDTRNCTLEEFKAFVEKHPRFFSKPITAAGGTGAEIINADLNESLENLLTKLKKRKRILEELVTQHEDLAAFCPDTVNTIRVITFVDIYDFVHILLTCGRFGRVGNIVDNFHGGGYSVVIDPQTGIIISDGINGAHERVSKHLDSGKVFKGFQYPCWEKVRAVVKEMAKIVPQLRHVGWDITIDDKGEPVLIEANRAPDVHITQSPDDTGRLYLYPALLEELQNYKKEEMRRLGWRVNNLPDFDSAYELNSKIWNPRLKFAADKLISDCTSLLDFGCRASKPAKKFCPANVKYFPVDFKQHDAEVIACNFNEDFPDIKADAILCTLTAEFVENLPQFLANMCRAAQKQILMWCRPIDRELNPGHRWKNNPFLTDFTEEFLIKTLAQNNFELNAQYPDAEAPSVILYDFRRMSAALQENIYGLSEGVFKACQFLGLQFPVEVPKKLSDSQEHMPSDFFGDDFELDADTKEKLCAERKWTNKKLAKEYSAFTEKYLSQRCFKHTKTDLNVYFCDLVLFSSKQNGATERDYFNFEFYRKSFSDRSSFRTQKHRHQARTVFNEHRFMSLVDNKIETNTLFAQFLHRDWIYTRKCTFEDFKLFVEKHPRFFSKLAASSFGLGAQIINVAPNEDLEKLFANLKREKRLLEEFITQHEELNSFCPNSVNTIRVNTILDIHNVVHILTTSGKFGRAGNIVDNFNGGGVAAIIDPQTGIIISDAINSIHERFQKHPDTGKTFKGFQYPCWEKVRAAVTEMAKLIPQIRHIGWDITINDKGEPLIVEANGNPDPGSQQSADSKGRLNLYEPLIAEMQNYKKEKMRRLGWRISHLRNLDSAYELDPKFWNPRRKIALNKLIPDCESLLDLGCRAAKPAKKFCPANVKYFPVDFKQHDAEVIACDFNEDFPDIKADAILCTLTAEFVENLPQFLANMCNAAQKQILMWCRPIDRELNQIYRWKNPFLTDFTEEFLIKTLAQNNFELNAQYPDAKVPSIILYDFRKTTLE